MTLANYITVSRIVMIIPVLYFFHNENNFVNWIALSIFIIAGSTDNLDGYIARKTKTESSLGALLDLIADKLLICIVLVWVTFKTGNQFFLFPALIILSRELSISALRQFLTESTGFNPVKVSFIAKSKTTLQIIAISFCLISPNFGQLFMQITIVLLWLSAYVSVYSLYDYLKSYKNKIK